MDFEKILSLLSEEIDFARANYVPIIREQSSKFLYDFIKYGGYKNILEIGTAIGFSGSLILSAGADKLTTIEINQDYYEYAQKTFKKLGYESSVEMLLGDAKFVIEDLYANKKKYDMIFLDGAKGQYFRYLPTLTKLLKKNGVIVADNVLLQGMVDGDGEIPRKKRSMVNNLRKYLELISKEPYESDIIRLEDGIAITKVKGDN